MKSRNFYVTCTLIALASASLAACSPEIGSDEWCAGMKEKPKGDWTASEAGDYTKYCILGVAEIGREKWCEKMQEKPKGDWTANEAADYARHCVFSSGDEE